MPKNAMGIDEAVKYGMDVLLGLGKYIGIIFLINIIGLLFIIIGNGMSEGDSFGLALMAIGLICIVIAAIIGFALSIGIGYKIWVDILVRSRQHKDVLTPLIVENPPE
tara:strand:+ start:64 stop:387 length:324 start_codon:yes stop_codon:yes gene_type:complete